MDYIPIIVCVLLFLICIGLGVRLYTINREMQSIKKQIIEKKNAGRNQPFTVDSFGASSVELVNAINDYVFSLEENLKEYARDREHLQRIIAGISHDFRTPLTSAAGYLQLMDKSDGLSDKEKEYLKIVIRKIGFLRELTDDFLDLSLVENSDTLSKTEIALIPFISEIALEQNEWIEAKGIKAEFELPEKNIKIITIEHDLRRIFENIFSNARKYANSRLTLNVFYDENNDSVKLIFENDVEKGYDIDIDDIFEPFVRSKDRHGEGSGLGLYVVKKLCGKLGIDIEATFINGVFGIKMNI